MSTQSLHLREVSRHQDHTASSHADERTPQGLALSLDAVDKSFGEHRVLQQIDLEIPSGQIVAIVGRSGCGKSTLLRIIAGLESHSGGHIHTGVNGHSGDNAHTGDSATADQTRMMFQDDRLLPWKKVIDNVGLGLSGDWKPRALEALAEVGLVDHADKWPAQLSGGQKQRVALARALIHQPRLLLLDEPLGALDALTRLEMQQLIERLWQQHGFTILLVTHDVAEAVQMGDRVIVLESGVVGMDLPVSLARPREHASPGLAAIESTVLHRVLAREASDEPHHDERRHDTGATLRWAL